MPTRSALLEEIAARQMQLLLRESASRPESKEQIMTDDEKFRYKANHCGREAAIMPEIPRAFFECLEA